MAIKVTDTNGKTTLVAGSSAKSGEPGKSAYDYAVDGGFTGTEEEFQSLMAQAQNLDGGPFLPLEGGTLKNGVCSAVFGWKYKTSANLGHFIINFLSSSAMTEILFTKNVDSKNVPTGGVTMGLNNGSTTPNSDPYKAVNLGLIATPTYNYHAANKLYVDQSIQSAISDSWTKAY